MCLNPHWGIIVELECQGTIHCFVRCHYLPKRIEFVCHSNTPWGFFVVVVHSLEEKCGAKDCKCYIDVMFVCCSRKSLESFGAFPRNCRSGLLCNESERNSGRPVQIEIKSSFAEGAGCWLLPLTRLRKAGRLVRERQKLEHLISASWKTESPLPAVRYAHLKSKLYQEDRLTKEN